jgi:hypothetical protein
MGLLVAAGSDAQQREQQGRRAALRALFSHAHALRSRTHSPRAAQGRQHLDDCATPDPFM